MKKLKKKVEVLSIELNLLLFIKLKTKMFKLKENNKLMISSTK